MRRSELPHRDRERSIVQVDRQQGYGLRIKRSHPIDVKRTRVGEVRDRTQSCEADLISIRSDDYIRRFVAEAEKLPST